MDQQTSNRFPPYPVDKQDAKKALGVPAHFVCLATGGTDAYFAPKGQYDFFKTMRKLLEARDNVFLLHFGLSKSATFVPDWYKEHPRVRLLGVLPDPSEVYRACDIFLESFPFPSLGATSEAILLGEVCPVVRYGKQNTFLNPVRTVMFGEMPISVTEEEYLNELKRLIDSLPMRKLRAENARKQIEYRNEVFAAQFSEIYKNMAQFEHGIFLPAPTLISNDASLLIHEELASFSSKVTFHEIPLSKLSWLKGLATGSIEIDEAREALHVFCTALALKLRRKIGSLIRAVIPRPTSK